MEAKTKKIEYWIDGWEKPISYGTWKCFIWTEMVNKIKHPDTKYVLEIFKQQLLN